MRARAYYRGTVGGEVVAKDRSIRSVLYIQCASLLGLVVFEGVVDDEIECLEFIGSSIDGTALDSG